MKKRIVILISFIIAIAHVNSMANDNDDDNNSSSSSSSSSNSISNSISSSSSSTNSNSNINSMEKFMVRKMDELKKLHSIKIYGDIVTLEKLDDIKVIETSDEKLEDPLIQKVDEFFNTRKIQIRLPHDGSTADLFGRALGKRNIDIQLNSLTQNASQGRTKIKRIILPILLALKLKALIVLPIVITLIGLVGIKGLGAGLAALLLAGAVSLKALLTPPSYPTRVSYGIVKPEIYHEHWHRSQEDNQPYRAWAPEISINSYPYHNLP